MALAPKLHDRALREAFRLWGGRSNIVPCGEDHVHVLDVPGHGSGAPLVLMHGFSASGPSQFGALAWHLRHHVARLVLPDLLGHGGSSLPRQGLNAPVLYAGACAALDRIAEPFLLFASSMSGGIAVRYAAENPDRVVALMLCSPTGAPISPEEHRGLMDTFAVESHAAALRFVERLFVGRRPLLRHLYAWGVRQQFRPAHLVALLEGAAEIPWLEAAHLRGLSMPVYLLWGAADTLLPAAHFDFYREHLPAHAVIERPAHFGHAPFLHQAGEVAERVRSFVRGATKTSAPD